MSAGPSAGSSGPSPAASGGRAGLWQGTGFGIIAIILSAACWGGATVMVKDALETLPPFLTLAVQLGASTLFLWIAAGLLRPGLPPGGKLRDVALSGLLEPGLAYGVSLPGLAMTSAANASVISAAEPAFICAIVWALTRQRPSAAVLACLAAALAGVLLMTVPGTGPLGAGNPAGDGLVLLGTLFAAFYVVASSRLVGGIAPVMLGALQQSAGLLFALALLAGTLAAGVEHLPWPLPWATLALAAGAGIIQYALAVWLYLTGLRVLGPSVAGVFLALIPAFGVSGAVLFLGEAPSPMQWIGGILVVASVAAIARRA